MVLPIIRKGLVKGTVLLGGDVLWVSGPDWLLLVKFLLLDLGFLDLLGLFLLLLVFVIVYLLNLAFFSSPSSSFVSVSSSGTSFSTSFETWR